MRGHGAEDLGGSYRQLVEPSVKPENRLSRHYLARYLQSGIVFRSVRLTRPSLSHKSLLRPRPRHAASFGDRQRVSSDDRPQKRLIHCSSLTFPRFRCSRRHMRARILEWRTQAKHKEFEIDGRHVTQRTCF